jgi:hypothetical protein
MKKTRSKKSRDTVPLKGQCHEITLGSFRIFQKFAEIFASQGAPPVSTTPVANCRRYQRHRRQIWHRYQQHRRQILPPVPLVLLTPHRWQIMGTISGCRHHKVNLKAKTYIYVNSTTQRCPNKIINIFLLEDFFHLPLVSFTPWCTLSREYLREFSKKSKWP